MKHTSVLLILLLGSSVGMSDDLSERISTTSPGTQDGTNADLDGEMIVVLPRDTPAQVHFISSGWQSGTLRAGDAVFVQTPGRKVEGGTIYAMTRAVRCGNAARGEFFVADKEVRIVETVEVPTVVEKEKVITRFVEVPVIVTRVEVREITSPSPPPCPTPLVPHAFIPPAGVAGVYVPDRPLNQSSIVRSDWRAIVGVAYAWWSGGQESQKPPKTPEDCGPPPPGGIPEPPIPGGNPPGVGGSNPNPPGDYFDPPNPAPHMPVRPPGSKIKLPPGPHPAK